MQSSFDVYETPEKQSGSSQIELLTLVKRFQKDEILIPHFQRPYVWKPEKLVQYIQTVITRTSIGVFVTYQEKGGGATFLADGLQRLTSAKRFLEDPQHYGFDFDSRQSELYLEAFVVDVQHRIYRNHAEAMMAFHRLNNGTSLTPAEYYKGILSGNELGQIILKSVPAVVDRHALNLVPSKIRGRGHDSKMLRDAISIFFQYISDWPHKYFWDASSTKLIDPGKSMETKLIDFLSEQRFTRDDVQKKIGDFDRYVASTSRTIESVIESTGQRYKPMSPALYRWILHLSLWTKNNKRPQGLFVEFLERTLSEQKTQKSMTARFAIAGTDPIVTVSTAINSLNDMPKMCRIFDIPLDQGRKRKQEDALDGMHNSHIRPFALFGEGETFPEAAKLNQIRGKKEVGT
jgi:hypothetical protein